MRQALGAGRARIARQLLTESLVLATTGGALGILVAVVGRACAYQVDLQRPRPALPFCHRSGLAGAGVHQRRYARHRHPVRSCAELPQRARRPYTIAPGERSSFPGGASQGGRRVRLGDALVVAQVALSVVVLVGAGLLVRTLHKLQTLDPGFDTHNVLLFGIDPSLAGYKDHQTASFTGSCRQRFEALPGRGVCQLFRARAAEPKLVGRRRAPRRCAPQSRMPTPLRSRWGWISSGRCAFPSLPAASSRPPTLLRQRRRTLR